MDAVAKPPRLEGGPAPLPTLAEALRVFARIACLSFGGPAGQIAVMHRILVEEKRWVSEERFLHALNFCMLLPGPEAQQLATYVGWLMHGVRGGLVAGGLFVVPGLLAIMALSYLYVLAGNLPVVAALFFGLKAAVLAVVVDAVLRIGGRALRSRAHLALASAAFIAIFFLAIPFPIIIIGAGLIAAGASLAGFRAFGPPATTAVGASAAIDELAAARTPPTAGATFRTVAAWLFVWLAPLALLWAWLGGTHVFVRIGAFFSVMAIVTFGGAYAVLAYVAQQAVENFGWLTAGEMLDGLGMAETTPGPLIMVLQFVGFMAAFRDPGLLPPLVAATLGGLLATWTTFAPCFLWIVAGAPYVEALRGKRVLAAALSGVTAAVVGVILNLAVWFAIHTLFRKTAELRAGPFGFDAPIPASADPWAIALATAAATALFVLRLGMVWTLAGAAIAGGALHLLGAV